MTLSANAGLSDKHPTFLVPQSFSFRAQSPRNITSGLSSQSTLDFTGTGLAENPVLNPILAESDFSHFQKRGNSNTSPFCQFDHFGDKKSHFEALRERHGERAKAENDSQEQGNFGRLGSCYTQPFYQSGDFRGILS